MSERVDIAALRETIDARLRARATFSSDSYGDQPIVFSGRQLKSFVPEPIAEARLLARSPEMRHHGEAYVFWRQALLLADFEDDYDFRGHFSRYYPTYEVMNNDQLRGYFSWRTKWRRGEVVPTETSFVYVCAYELLHGIGVAGPREGYDALRRLASDYGPQDPRMAHNISSWLDGYVVYWDLPRELLGSLSHVEADEALGVLLAWEVADNERLFGALTRLSSYRIESSALYKRHPEELRQVVCATYRVAATHHAKLKRSLAETYFGVSAEQDFALLANAVFADPRPREDYSYELSPLDHIRRRGSLWARDRYAGNLRPNRKLGALLKTIDAVMRDQLGFEPALDPPLTTKYLHKAVREQTQALVDARREAERRAVHIDLSRLGSIRAAADLTRDRLIVEEDGAEASSLVVDKAASTSAPAVLPSFEVVASGTFSETRPGEGGTETAVGVDPMTKDISTSVSTNETPAVQVSIDEQVRESAPAVQVSLNEQAKEAASNSLALSATDLSLLELILDGGDVRTWEKETREMASLAIERINEALMDEIGDVVIDAAAEPPEVFEDYQDDVRELICG